MRSIPDPSSELSAWLQRAETVKPLAQWVCLLEAESEPNVAWDIARPDGASVQQVVRNHCKPQRAAEPITWVVAMHCSWSEQHLELTPEDVIPLIRTRAQHCSA